jgi:hypothetical protein
MLDELPLGDTPRVTVDLSASSGICLDEIPLGDAPRVTIAERVEWFGRSETRQISPPTPV